MKKLLLWLDKYAEASVMGVMILLTTIFMSVQIVLRYCFGNSLIWVEEVVVYFNVWIGFLGISYCVRYKNDMRIDVSAILPKNFAKILRFISDGILFLSYLYLGNTGIKVVRALMRTHQKSPAARIPMYFVYSALLVGCILATIRFLQRFYLYVRQAKKGE
jgi:TRAP-type C4-dicarboxylate transport system permease small subunit